ncbi:hypothetical protein B0T14DRAFT_493160 [Immersiella caudata]|uniref:Uncharacterized protein n=1 Tax=Immersiella caudata TaxID=314043 RepID=A0AA39X427_9PEZI|nr:hypothetical protein B0T14DRAFT_493160 [Immersiella caudata]
MADTASALKAAGALVEALKNTPKPSPAQHVELLRLASNVIAMLESPYVICTRFIETLSSSGPISAADLAAVVNIPATAMERLARMVLVNEIFTETSPSTMPTTPSPKPSA